MVSNRVGKFFSGLSSRRWGDARSGNVQGKYSTSTSRLHLTMMLQSAGYHEQNARAADLRWSIVTGGY